MHDLKLGSTGSIIEIMAPRKGYLSIRGKYQSNTSSKKLYLHEALASRLMFIINDLDRGTRIHINKQIKSQIEKEETIDTMYYAELPLLFKRNILLSDKYKLGINIISPNINIDKEKIEFTLSLDYWQRI